MESLKRAGVSLVALAIVLWPTWAALIAWSILDPATFWQRLVLGGLMAIPYVMAQVLMVLLFLQFLDDVILK